MNTDENKEDRLIHGFESQSTTVAVSRGCIDFQVHSNCVGVPEDQSEQLMRTAAARDNDGRKLRGDTAEG